MKAKITDKEVRIQGKFFLACQLWDDYRNCFYEPSSYQLYKHEMSFSMFLELTKEAEKFGKIISLLCDNREASLQPDYKRNEWLERIREEVGE